jgi:hypothetical protein
MSAESKPALEFEIGHVLLIDIVGYSKRLIDEQRALLNDLNKICGRGSAMPQSNNSRK